MEELRAEKIFKTTLIGYKKSSVNFFVKDVLGYVNTLRADVDYLKQEQSRLQTTIEELIERARREEDHGVSG